MLHKNKRVIERLRERKEGKKDNNRIGLIIEGGGMRGVFGAGVCNGLAELGYNNCFDYVYSSSSGSCSGAFLLAGQGETSSELYYKYLNSFRFIRPWRFGKIMDLDYLFDEICKKKEALDLEKLKQEKTELKVFIVNAENGMCEHYTNHDTVDFYKVLKASCALPFLYGPVMINGTDYMDGNIGKALPIENALTDGCTDLLVVLTVPEHFRKKTNYARRLMNYFGMMKYGKRFKRQFHSDEVNYNESLDVILGKMPIYRDINIYVISPDFKLNNLEIRTKILRQAAEKGILAAKKAFE